MKGFIKTLEASIAIMLILVTVIVLGATTPSYPEKSFMIIGNGCLDEIYNKGDLRDYAVNNMKTALEDDLDDCLPATLNYEAKICSSTDCTASDLPESATIVLVSRLLSGNSYEVAPRIVNIWMWS